MPLYFQSIQGVSDT
jgi:Ca2+/Na+ antiporter